MKCAECENLEGLINYDKKIIAENVSLHKYYLSVKLGYDVGLTYAVIDFIQIYGAEIREHYCNNLCKINQKVKRNAHNKSSTFSL